MRNGFLRITCLLVIGVAAFAAPFPEGPVALGLVLIVSTAFMVGFRWAAGEEREFITNVFLVALALRMAFGILLHVFGWREFFGGDARAYDINGNIMANAWLGRGEVEGALAYQTNPASGAGWGMNYLTAIIYLLVGRNIFAAQSFCAVIGAATAPMVYFCASRIFSNRSVSRVAAIAIALFPSFIIWSGQLLKDGLIIFLLVTAMTMVMELQKKVSYGTLAALVFSLFGILSLRFYIFYMVLVAVGGSFVIGMSTSNRSVMRRTVVLVALGISLTYLGVMRNATVEYEVFGSLSRVQSSRMDLARTAESGFNEESDVSTTEGAISAIPIGLAYLMFAPFPWQAANLRQAITIPEVLAWWAMMPLLVMGLAYTIKNRLRNAFPVLLFSLLLTLAYSIFQGNVGTAYRQRTQIQVFLFILIAVGWTVYRERKENERLIRVEAQRRVDAQLRGLAQRT